MLDHNGNIQDWKMNDVSCVVDVKPFDNSPLFFNYDGTGVTSMIGSTGSPNGLFRWNPTVVGLNDYNVRCFSGLNYEMLSLRYAVHLRRNFAAHTGGSYPESVRLSIVMQKNAASAAPITWSELFGQSIQGAVSGSYDVLAPVNPTRCNEFIVLRDVWLYFPPTATGGVNTQYTSLTASAGEIVSTGVIDLRGVYGQLKQYSAGNAFTALNKIISCIACQQDASITTPTLVAEFNCRLYWKEAN